MIWLEKTRGHHYILGKSDRVYVGSVICVIKKKQISRFRYELKEKAKSFIESEIKLLLEGEKEHFYSYSDDIIENLGNSSLSENSSNTENSEYENNVMTMKCNDQTISNKGPEITNHQRLMPNTANENINNLESASVVNDSLNDTHNISDEIIIPQKIVIRQNIPMEYEVMEFNQESHEFSNVNNSHQFEKHTKQNNPKTIVKSVQSYHMRSAGNINKSDRHISKEMPEEQKSQNKTISNKSYEDQNVSEISPLGFEETAQTDSEFENNAIALKCNDQTIQTKKPEITHNLEFSPNSTNVNINNSKTVSVVKDSWRHNLDISNEIQIPQKIIIQQNIPLKFGVMEVNQDTYEFCNAKSCDEFEKDTEQNDPKYIVKSDWSYHNAENYNKSDGQISIENSGEKNSNSETISKNSYEDKKVSEFSLLGMKETVEIDIDTTSAKHGKRIYDKRHSCYICQVQIIKMARHLELRHANELAIAKLLAMDKKSSQRRKGFIELIRIGDFYHNMEVLASKSGQLFLCRRPLLSQNYSYNDFGPCPNCLGFVTKSFLSRHAKNCTTQKISDCIVYGKSIKKESSTIVNSMLVSSSAEFRKNILDKFRNDEITSILKTDDVIIGVGVLLYEKHGNSQNDLIRQTMRQLSRLVTSLRKNNPAYERKNLAFFLDCSKFDEIIEAVKELCIVNAKENEKNEYGIPSLALKIGHSEKMRWLFERTSSKIFPSRRG